MTSNLYKILDSEHSTGKKFTSHGYKYFIYILDFMLFATFAYFTMQIVAFVQTEYLNRKDHEQLSLYYGNLKRTSNLSTNAPSIQSSIPTTKILKPIGADEYPVNLPGDSRVFWQLLF